MRHHDICDPAHDYVYSRHRITVSRLESGSECRVFSSSTKRHRDRLPQLKESGLLVMTE